MKIMINKVFKILNFIFLQFFILFFLVNSPSIYFADENNSEILYPVTTKYEEITSLDKVKENFSLSGTASWYNDWAWLTPNSSGNHVGSIYLNNKLQLDSNFHIEGKLAITLKGMGSNGDGIGIVFHTGDANQIGQTGGNLGVVGLPNAIALVLDTYKNTGEPNVPYIGIWKTDSAGNKSVLKTYPTNLGTSGYKELQYTFDYDASTRIITYQIYTLIDNALTPVISDNNGLGYQFTIPTEFLEYAFSITGSTGGNFNNQYASISIANIPFLVTNTPQVTNQSLEGNNVILELKDKNGLSYPEGSIAYVNDIEYSIDQKSTITIPNDVTSIINLSVKSFKQYNNNRYDALVSDTIRYEIVKKVKMTINYIDSLDKNSIFSEAINSSLTKEPDIVEATIGESITDTISKFVSDGSLKLTYDGYDDVSPDKYITNANSNEQEFLTVQEKDFDIFYCYNPRTQLLSVPSKINFGIISPGYLFPKNQTIYPTNPISNIRILNTDRTVNWILKAKMSTNLVRKTDDKELDGYLFYENENSEFIRIFSYDVILGKQKSDSPVQDFQTYSTTFSDTSRIGIHLYNDQVDNYGNYTGQIEWTLDVEVK